MTMLPPRVALVELLQSINAGASVEVQSQSLARVGPLDVDTITELLMSGVDLVVRAHRAGSAGIDYPRFLSLMHEVAVSTS